MKPKVGDRIVIESQRVAQSARAGVIKEVIRKDPPRLRIHWEDGHESILAPSSGSASIEKSSKQSRKP